MRQCLVASHGSEQAIEKARQFADTAHGVNVGKISRQFEEKLAASRNQLAARGLAVSGNSVAETARVEAERITALLQSRLDCLLEGFELHGVTIDDSLLDRVVREITQLRSTWISACSHRFSSDPILSRRLVPEESYVQLVEQQAGLLANEIKTQVDRKRLASKKIDANTFVNIYHVQGSNNRWLTNSQDYSVNVVTQSTDEIFANLRQQIESRVAAGDDEPIFLRSWPR